MSKEPIDWTAALVAYDPRPSGTKASIHYLGPQTMRDGVPIPAGDPYVHLVLVGSMKHARYCDPFGCAMVDGRIKQIVQPPPPPKPKELTAAERDAARDAMAKAVAADISRMAKAFQEFSDGLVAKLEKAFAPVVGWLEMVATELDEIKRRLPEPRTADMAEVVEAQLAAETPQPVPAAVDPGDDQWPPAEESRRPPEAPPPQVRKAKATLRSVDEFRRMSEREAEQLGRLGSEELVASVRRIQAHPDTTKVIVGTSNMVRKKSGVIGAVVVINDITGHGLHLRGIDTDKVENVYAYTKDNAARDRLRSFIINELSEDALRQTRIAR